MGKLGVISTVLIGGTEEESNGPRCRPVVLSLAPVGSTTQEFANSAHFFGSTLELLS